MRSILTINTIAMLLTMLNCVLVQVEATSSAARISQSPTTYWMELTPSDREMVLLRRQRFQDIFDRETPPPLRKMLWCGRQDHRLTWMPDAIRGRYLGRARRVEMTEPHPMRTDMWNVSMHWKEKQRRQGRLEVEFHENGFVRCCFAGDDQDGSGEDTQHEMLGIGKWEVQPWGVFWTIHDEKLDREYSFSADLLLNPFGDQPKMIRGVVTRQSGSKGRRDEHQDDGYVTRALAWFRPVVGTFRAVGTGEDTADLGYKKRRAISS